MERNSRKVYTGTVISDKMDKTITVLVGTHVKHKLTSYLLLPAAL